MRLGQVPMPGDFGGGYNPPPKPDKPVRAAPDKHGADKPTRSKAPSEPPPVKPGGPVLDYKFGDSQGWNKPGPDNDLGLSLIDRPEPNRNLGLSLREPRENGKTDWLDLAKQAYRQADQNGLVGATLATVGLFALAPAVGPSVLGAMTIGAAAGAATYGWTNAAVHLTGGGNALESAAGLFSPWGLPLFVGETLAGMSSETALGHANVAGQIGDLRIPDLPQSRLDVIRFSAEMQQLIKNASELGIFTGTTSPPEGSSAIRKPGGPVKIIMP